MMLKLQETKPLLLIFANKLPVALFVNCQTAGVIGMIRTAFSICVISARNFKRVYIPQVVCSSRVIVLLICSPTVMQH